jgi:DNA-directed RNA polymerase II subunit RPB2
MEGVYGDATPFSESSVNIAEKLCERLAKSGFERQGWEEMYSGFTGEPLEAKVFIGPTYYQRLKHMVKDKIHSRAQGHVTTLNQLESKGILKRVYLVVLYTAKHLIMFGKSLKHKLRLIS